MNSNTYYVSHNAFDALRLTIHVECGEGQEHEPESCERGGDESCHSHAQQHAHDGGSCLLTPLLGGPWGGREGAREEEE